MKYPFRATSDGTVSARLAGSAFHSADGGTNTLTLTASDLANGNNPVSSAEFATIGSCRVVVCDGAQYEAPNRWGWYDYNAISEKALLAN